MPLPPVHRKPPKAPSGARSDAAGELAPSPLDVALSHHQASHRRGIRQRGRVLEVELSRGSEVSESKPLAAVQEPLLDTLIADLARRPEVARALRPDTRSLARAVAPLMPAAMEQNSKETFSRGWNAFGRFLSGLGSSRIWRWAMEAIWEGESIADYVDARVRASEVVEIVLHDPTGSRVLSSVVLPGVKETKLVSADLDASNLTEGDGKFYVFIGQRCRLSARITGKVSAELKRFFSSLTAEVDELLDETATDTNERARLLPLKLRTGLSREGPFTNAYASRRAAIAVLVMSGLVLGFLTWVGVSEYRWQRFVEILQREPGIQILRYDRGWGRSLIVGTRDPDARDPIAVAEALGLNPGNIDLRFKEAESIEGPFSQNPFSNDQPLRSEAAGKPSNLIVPHPSVQTP